MQLLVAKVSKILLKNTRKHPFADIDLLLFDHDKQIAQLPESKVCADIMQNDVVIRREFGSRISDNTGKPVEKPDISSISRLYFLPLLIQYFRAVEFFEVDVDVFYPLYYRFEEYLYSDSLRYEVLAPLVGFDCDVDLIQLDKNFKIRKMKKEEVQLLWMPREPYLPPIIDPIDASLLKYTLEVTYSRKKGKMSIDMRKKPIPDELFEGAITTLRLFKSGDVDFYFTQRTPLTWDPHGAITYSFKERGDFRGRREYNLRQTEIDSFIEFWKEFGDTILKKEYHGHNYLDIAIKRFNLGLEEQDSENKFIDFFVAFEALYLLENFELSFRLSLRTATLLGITSEEKNSIFQYMKDAYTLRSSIVHGKTPKIRKKIVDLKVYVPKLENYLRQSIIRFLRITIQFKNQALILSDLDQQILR